MKIAGEKRREWALSNRWHGQVGVGGGGGGGCPCELVNPMGVVTRLYIYWLVSKPSD